MSRRQEILKDAGIYAISSYIAQLFDMANGILLRHFLGPHNMGVWAFLQVIQNYAKHAGLGITTATARDVPYYLGKGDKSKAQEIQNLVFSFTVLSSIAAAGGIVLFAVLNRQRYSDTIFYGLIVVAALVVLQRIYNLFVVLLRSYKEFAFTGMLNLVSSLSGLLLTVVFTWRFQLPGFFVSLILNYIFLIGFILARTRYRFSFFFKLSAFLPLLSLGLSMVVSDLVRTVLTSIDRIMLTQYFGFAALGHYSIALMAANYLYSLPNMLSIIVFPHFQEVFAKADSPKDLEKLLLDSTLCLAYVFPFLIGCVWFLSAWAVPIILPQYTPGLPALKFLVLSSFFLAVTHFFSSFIITIKKHWQLVPLQALVAVFGFAITWLFIAFGWGIEGVALAGVFTAFINFLVLSLFSLNLIKPMLTRSAFYSAVLGVFVYFISALILCDRLFLKLSPGLFKFLIQYLLFCAVMSPFLWWLEKGFHLFSTLQKLIRESYTIFTNPPKRNPEGRR